MELDLEFEIRKVIGIANYSKKRQFRNTVIEGYFLPLSLLDTPFQFSKVQNPRNMIPFLTVNCYSWWLLSRRLGKNDRTAYFLIASLAHRMLTTL